MPSRGIIFIAHGDRFVDEALFAAASIRQHCDLPITLFTDRPVEDETLERVELIDVAHNRIKVDHMALTPYDHTLYLDSDVMVVRDPSDTLELLDRFDLAATHDHARKKARLSKLIPRYGAIPYSFPEYNCGVIAYRKSEAISRFFRLWQETYYTYREETSGYDQGSFRIAAWESDIAIHSLPFEYNVRNQRLRRRMGERAKEAGSEGLLEPRILHWHRVGRVPRWKQAISEKHRPMKQ